MYLLLTFRIKQNEQSKLVDPGRGYWPTHPYLRVSCWGPLTKLLCCFAVWSMLVSWDTQHHTALCKGAEAIWPLEVRQGPLSRKRISSLSKPQQASLCDTRSSMPQHFRSEKNGDGVFTRSSHNNPSEVSVELGFRVQRVPRPDHWVEQKCFLIKMQVMGMHGTSFSLHQLKRMRWTRHSFASSSASFETSTCSICLVMVEIYAQFLDIFGDGHDTDQIPFCLPDVSQCCSWD